MSSRTELSEHQRAGMQQRIKARAIARMGALFEEKSKDIFRMIRSIP
jgi:hypothetical protein